MIFIERGHIFEDAGPCASSFDASDMSEEEKLAFANQCHVDFPCQVSWAVKARDVAFARGRASPREIVKWIFGKHARGVPLRASL